MRLIDADKIIQKTYGVVIEDMFHFHETVEVVSVIDIEIAPTVKAIPIEYIKKQVDIYLDLGLDTIAKELNYLILEWERKNGTV